MTTNREQTRRDAEAMINGNEGVSEIELAQDCLDLLAELEQAERDAVEWQALALEHGNTASVLEDRVEQAEQQRDEWKFIAAERGTRMDEIQTRAEKAERVSEARLKLLEMMSSRYEQAVEDFDQLTMMVRKANDILPERPEFR